MSCRILMVACGALMTASALGSGFSHGLSGTKPWTHENFLDDPQEFHFAIVADRTGGERPGFFGRAMDQLNLLRPEFVMSVGDLVAGGGASEPNLRRQWAELHDFVNRLEMPFFYVVGNHDVWTGFTGMTPARQTSIDLWKEFHGTNTYYNFTYKDCHFVCFDTMERHDYFPPREPIPQNQVDWALAEMRKNAKARWHFLFMHKPIDWTSDRWLEFERKINGFNYTVFCGDWHNHCTAVRHGKKYYMIGTTGGCWDCGLVREDLSYGVMDSITWVTVTKKGPVVANLALSGIHGDTIQTCATTKGWIETPLDYPSHLAEDPAKYANERNSALIPAEVMQGPGYDWHFRHAVILRQGRVYGGGLEKFKQGRRRVILLGDEQASAQASRYGADCQVFDMGFAGDRIENVLWRVQQGTLAGYAPDEILISAGRHNEGKNSAAEIAAGIDKLVGEVRRRAQGAKLIVSTLSTRIEGLMIDHLIEAAHVGDRPCFSWRMATDRQGACQTAYRIRVSCGDSPCWDSGEVADGASVDIPYAGSPLVSARRYTWTVTVKDERGVWTTSEPATFSTGFLAVDDWKGSAWIAPQGTEPWNLRTAVFRRTVTNAKPVREAWLTVASAGVFEAYAAGQTISDDFLKPGSTYSQKTLQACTYEVGAQIDRQEGATNVFAVVVSASWSRDRIAARNRPNRRTDPQAPPALRAQLVLRYVDGTEERIGTDASWRAADADPVTSAGIYEGETIDARRGRSWLAGTDPDWPCAREVEPFAGTVRSFQGPPVRLRHDRAMKPCAAYVVKGARDASAESFGTAIVVRKYRADEPMALAPGEQLVLDFGQNASAVPEFELEGPRGATVTVRHAEMLNEGGGLKSRGNDGPAGTPYLANLRSSWAGLRYTCRGGGCETCRPTFTFFGYRYVGLTTDLPVTVRRIRSVPVTSVPQGYDTGFFASDNPRLNRLFENCRWGMYSNYLSVPTDCPQRDERVGWTADTQVFVPAAAYLADCRAFLAKWMGDMRDCQRSDGCFSQIAPENAVRGYVIGWTDAGVVVPYLLWHRFGDVSAVRANWSAMVRYMDYVRTRGAQDAQPYGDWLSYEYGADMEWLKPIREKLQLPRKRLLGGAYRVWMARRMAEMAAALGRAEDERTFRADEARETASFRAECLNPDGTIKSDCNGQTSALFALYLNLLPNEAAVETTRRELRENFRAHGNCLQTGFLGTAILLDAVAFGLKDTELAYTLLLQDRNPSWLYSVDQGATTIWERWNSYTKDRGFGPVAMNSFNHYAYGAVAGWMFTGIAGIRADASVPGFRRFTLAPLPDRRLGAASAQFDSPYGRIASAWKFDEKGAWTWTFTVPPNTTAHVVTPSGVARDYAPGTFTVVESVQK